MLPDKSNKLTSFAMNESETEVDQTFGNVDLQNLDTNSHDFIHNLLQQSLRGNYSRDEILSFLEQMTATKNHTQSYQVPIIGIILLSLLYGSISLVAVFGNACVMWIVATSRNMHSVTNYFIANLALADIIIGLFAIPFQFQAALLQRWLLPHFMCAFCPFFQTVSVNASIFTLTAIAVDRYRAIVKPFNIRPSKFKSKLIIGSVWLFSVILAIPNGMAPKVIFTEDEIYGGLKPFCSERNLSPEFMRPYKHLLVGMQYFAPLAIISFAYIRIGWALWGSETPGNAIDNRDAHVLRNKKKVIKMLFVVVALFALCWAPLQSYYVLEAIYPSVNHYKYIHYIWFCAHWLAMSNSCCNPFIYAIYNDKFKREFRYKFQCLFRDGNDTNDIGSRYHASFRSTRVTGLTTVDSRVLNSTTSLRRKSPVQVANSECNSPGRSNGEEAPLACSSVALKNFDDQFLHPDYPRQATSDSLM